MIKVWSHSAEAKDILKVSLIFRGYFGTLHCMKTCIDHKGCRIYQIDIIDSRHIKTASKKKFHRKEKQHARLF